MKEPYSAGAAAVGLRLRQQRLKRGWSQEGLCRDICAASYLSKIEQGQVQAAPELLELLFRRLELPWYGESLPELERLVDLNVVCTISSVDTGLALNALAENRSTVAEAHIQVDTGMGFGGFLVGEPEKILLAYRSLPNVALSGIYTQIHAAPAGQEAEHQLQQFQRVLDAIHAAGFETGTVHAAGSYALMHCDLARMDAVRAGSVLLGRCRRTKDDGLSTVGHGEAGIAEMRWLPKGHTVGAEKTAVLKAPTRVAVVPVGYQHGFGVERPRPAGLLGTLGRWRRGRRLYVRVNGQRARVIGSVGVSETLVDVTDLKCSAGDVVSFDLDPMYARGCVRQYR